MNKIFIIIKKKKNLCILIGAILAVLFLGGYIYLSNSHRPDDQDATEGQIEEAVQAVEDDDYDRLQEIYDTADAMIDSLDISDEDKEKKHDALKAYGDAIAAGKLSKSEAEEFADLIADIEEVSSTSSTEDGTADLASEDVSSGQTTEDKAYDEAYLDQDGNMHYTKKLSAEEFYNYEIRFKGVSKADAKKTMEENIASGWTEIYVPVNENGEYINE